MTLQGNNIILSIRNMQFTVQSNDFGYQLSFLTVTGRAELVCSRVSVNATISLNQQAGKGLEVTVKSNVLIPMKSQTLTLRTNMEAEVATQVN